MKILMVNKFYYIKGGSERYYFLLKHLYESHGHEVIDFSMEDERNYESPYSKYFVRNVDYNNNNDLITKIKLASSIIYSKEARSKFEKLVKDTKPDVVHLHIFQHQISPSILDVVKKYNIPTIYTAHDLKMICLNYKMMHHNKICEECKNGHYINCIKYKCVKDSRLKSMVNMIEGYFHKWKKSYDAIDLIITPSCFYKDKFVQFGINPEKIMHIPNFIEDSLCLVSKIEKSKEYFLYSGRLSEEKGIMTLLKAIQNTDFLLYILGDGPLKSKIEAYIEENNMNNVVMWGFQKGQELMDFVANARAVILPSEWYENGPYSAIEALKLSRPIIGTDIGGIPELVHNNGYLFEYKNVTELREKMSLLMNADEIQYKDMEKASYELFNTNYTEDIHYSLLCEGYRKIGLDLS